MSHQIGTKELMLGVAVGSLLGGVTAFIFAPKSGKLLRKQISDIYCDLSEKTQNFADSTGKTGKRIFENVEDQAEDYLDKAKNIYCTLTDWMHSNKKNNGYLNSKHDFIMGGLAGGILGATAALLLTPKSGEDLREDIEDAYHGVEEKGYELAENAKSKADDLLTLIQGAVNFLTDETKDLSNTLVKKGKSIKKNSLNNALGWAAVGLRLWKHLQKRR